MEKFDVNSMFAIEWKSRQVSRSVSLDTPKQVQRIHQLMVNRMLWQIVP